MAIMRLLLSVLAAGVLALAGPGPASGHAVLLETEPADGAVLDAAPSEIVFRFNEPVSPIRVQVLGPDGAAVADTNAARAEDRALIVALPPLGHGTHLVSYRVRSLDGHPVGGSVSFAVGAASPAPDASAATGHEPLWRAAEAAARLVKILVVFAVAGGAFYLVFVDRGAAAMATRFRGLAAAGLVGILAALLEAGFYGALLLDEAPAAFLGTEVWQAGLSGAEGLSVMILAAGLVVVTLARAAPQAGLRNGLLVAGAAAASASFALTGHAAGAEPRWLAMPALTLHVGLAAFWAGSLLPLWLATRGHSAAMLAPLVARFSKVAVGAVTALVIAGIVLALLILERPADLVDARYGWILIVKLTLVGALVAVAAANRLWLTPRLATGDEAARSRLARNILGEMVLMVGIVSAAVMLAQQPPPRQIGHDHHRHHHRPDAAEPERHAVAVESGRLRAFVTIEPARAGETLLMVRITYAEGSLIEPLEVTVDIASEALGIEPFRRALRPVGAGHFALTGEDFSLSGTWQLRIDALITDFDKEIFRAEVDIR